MGMMASSEPILQPQESQRKITAFSMGLDLISISINNKFAERDLSTINLNSLCENDKITLTKVRHSLVENQHQIDGLDRRLKYFQSQFENL